MACRRGAGQPPPRRDVDGVHRSCAAPGGDLFLESLLPAFVLINLITARDEFFLPVIFSRSSATATLTLGITQAAVDPQYQSVARGAEKLIPLPDVGPSSGCHGRRGGMGCRILRRSGVRRSSRAGEY